MRAKSFQLCWLCATLWTISPSAPLSTGFFRQECWSGLPWHALLQGIFPTQRSNPCLLCLLHWQAVSLHLSYQGRSFLWGYSDSVENTSPISYLGEIILTIWECSERREERGVCKCVCVCDYSELKLSFKDTSSPPYIISESLTLEFLQFIFFGPNFPFSAGRGSVVTWLSGVGGELAAYLFFIQNFKEASNF